MTKQTVLVKDEITFDSFGCSSQHFDQYIKGKPLNVLAAYKTITLVEDETEQQWTVHNEDLKDEETEVLNG